MKIKFLAATLLMAGASLSASAISNKDGIDYYKVGELGNAQELLSRNINQSDNVAEAYYYLGMISYKADDVAAAEEYFNNAVTENAKYAYGYIGQGLVALKKGDDKAAKTAFDKARKQVKKDPKVETEIARAYNMIDAVKYEKEIAKCIEVARNKTNMTDPESYIFEGDNYAAQEKWGDAAGQYELAFTNEPDNVEANVKWANTYYNVNPTMALAHLEKFNSDHPNTALVQRQLAEKYYDDDQAAKAAEKYGDYVNNPNHFYLDEARYAQLLYIAADYAKSYEVSVGLQNKVDPSNSNYFFMQRMKFYNKTAMKDYETACQEGAKLFSMPVPKLAQYEYKDLTDYAVALQKTERDSMAVEYLLKAYDMRPSTDLLRSLGDVYNNIKQTDKCLEVTEKICAAEDADYLDFYDAGRRYFNAAVNAEGDARAAYLVSARKYITKSYEAKSDNISIVRLMCRIDELEEGDEVGKAVDNYKKLLTLLDGLDEDKKADYAPYYRSAYLYLANAAMKAGDKVAAKENYLKRLEWDPDNKDLRDYIARAFK